jgi:hypothetical protein
VSRLDECQIGTFVFHNCDEANENINVVRTWSTGYATMYSGVYDEEYKINFCPFCGEKLSRKNIISKVR